MAESLKFQLEARTVPGSGVDDAPIDVAGIAWCGPSEHGVHSLLGRTGKTPRHDATAWLVPILGDGAMPEGDVRSAAEDAGHSWTTVKRAKEALGVTSVKHGFGKEGWWEWSLP